MTKSAIYPRQTKVKYCGFFRNVQFVKVGDNKDIKMEASLVVFATNIDLEQRMKEGLFRADLYDRMNPPPIEIPPLRDRRDEIIPLG